MALDIRIHSALIAFGANLGDREATAQLALREIQQRVGRIVKISSLMENPPLVLPGEDPESQPWFLNAVWLVETQLDAESCLQQLLEIERVAGRVRERRWGPRIIDLDLLAYDSQILESPDLTLPHPAMHERVFVLKPLCEILPDWQHPVRHQSAAELLRSLESDD